MFMIKNVKTLDGRVIDQQIDSQVESTLDAQGKLTMMPALIDPHVHFRTPGAEQKENWLSGAKAALAGGITTVFDMPDNLPICCTKQEMQSKTHLIEQQLAQAAIPLHYELYFGADESHLEEIPFVKNQIVGLAVYLGSANGNLVLDDEKALDRVFQIAAQENLIVAVHAEDEKMIKKQKAQYPNPQDPALHSKIRDRKAAIRATEQAIELAEKYSAQLLVLSVSTAEETDLIRQAKQGELLVYMEVTPHHLFLTEEDYANWGTLVQTTPPLRTKRDQEALWKAIQDGTVDMIGSDHSPHLLQEKKLPYGQAPSGVPGIETILPLLLNAHQEQKISMELIVALTRTNALNIFNLEPNSDLVLVDLNKTQTLDNKMLKTKCGWSPFAGRTLTGWPIYTILNGQAYPCSSQ